MSDAYKLYSIVFDDGYVVRCNAYLHEAESWLKKWGEGRKCHVIEQKPVAPVVQDSAIAEPSLKQFATYLLGRASESKVYRDKAAKEWRYSCAQEHQVAIDIYEELADFILSGDAKKEL